jgi:hypothetical protein
MLYMQNLIQLFKIPHKTQHAILIAFHGCFCVPTHPTMLAHDPPHVLVALLNKQMMV